MPIRWALLLLLLLSTTTVLGASHISRSNNRIVNGVPISIRDAPWQVSIQALGHHICGGSIISSKTIITAAHCVLYIPAFLLQVRAGSKYWNRGGQLLHVAQVKRHPNYGTNPTKNDIAIVRLDQRLNYTRNSYRIRLAKETPKRGTVASVSGWGLQNENATVGSRNLQMATLRIIDRRTCQMSKYAILGKKVYKGMICATSSARDACQGDSGGPLVVDNQLVGIVSWGIGCARKGHPGVYTDVAHYREWIFKYVRRRE
ncbi:trypsin alpha-like [Drosophila novamexicana]|uniref:trypsin alpha-like n=1 Tax=Drosophila novamexicana TaxID=47314 RepID=UPI0011E5E428|nr:trypsin alpha-like [Drosophila novamexicana]